MKKFILSVFVIVSFGFYVISQNGANSSNNFVALAPVTSSNNVSKKSTKTVAVVPTTPVINDSQTTPVIQPTKPNPTPTPTPTPAPVIVPPKKTGIYNDGTYTGNSVDAYYGNVQVQVTIANSKITSVQALDYPHDARNSVRINSRAIPILVQETISAQNANINGVSGASETSPAFIQSLTSALNQAKV